MFLGIDCSGVTANLALLTPDNQIFFVSTDTLRQADVIFPLLEQLLADAKITTADLTAIGAITGPGSFTGIRVGLSLAQGLADGLGIPAYGVDAFTALRGDQPNAWIVLESKRAELYAQHQNENYMLTADEIMQRNPALIIHNTLHENLFGVKTKINMAVIAARHAMSCHQAKIPGEILSPYYVRDADAKPAAG